jgi:hypothetical protein
MLRQKIGPSTLEQTDWNLVRHMMALDEVRVKQDAHSRAKA